MHQQHQGGEKLLSILDDLEHELATLHVRGLSQMEERYSITAGLATVKQGSDEHAILKARLEQINQDIERTNAEMGEKLVRYDAEKLNAQKRFRRPNGWFASAISRWLGPVPSPSVVVQPTADNLAKVKSYRLAALALVAVAITALLTLVMTMPWMGLSPARLIMMGANSLLGGWGIVVSYAIITVLFMAFARGTRYQHRYVGKFWDRAAMLEEQWFRMGAENWTTRQRLYSSVAFGFVHVGNIIYPLASLIVVGAVGAVFMAVYLRVFRQTHSTELATLASAKLHATYNRFAVVYILVAIGITIGYSMYTSAA